MSITLIILGAGGHARVLLDALRCSGTNHIAGFVDTDPRLAGTLIDGVPVLGTDEYLSPRASEPTLRLVNGIGSVRNTTLRKNLFLHFRSQGFRFANVIHPAACLAPNVKLGEGVQIMAGAIVQTGCQIDDNALINTGAIVDHDCCISAHAHIAPGATLSGTVRIGTGAHVGTAACVIQNTNIGEHALIAAGAVVIEHVAAGVTVMGVPARRKSS